MGKNTRNINEVFGRKAVVSSEPDASWPLPNELIGLEIECEDVNYGRNQFGLNSNYWTTHNDGSLRNGTEFVLATPTGGRQLIEAINQFFSAGLTYNISPRTSIHVHINASDNMTFDQFRNMFVIMYLFEPSVFRWADENRKWCGYCAPLTDLAPDRLIPFLTENNNDSKFVQAVRGVANSDRYYGFNVSAFHRHGTVEFRYFPCTTDRERVIEWIKFCMYVKRAARQIDGPEALVADLTTERSLNLFINEYFGEVATHVTRGLDFADCLARAADMRAMLNVDAATVRGSTYRTTRSRGMTKFLGRTFPAAVGEGPSEGDATAASASDIFDALQATPRPRVRTGAQANRATSIRTLEIQLSEARAEQERTRIAFANNLGSSIRRNAYTQAMEVTQRLQTQLDALRNNPSAPSF